MKILKFKLSSKLDFFNETMKWLESRIFRLLYFEPRKSFSPKKSLTRIDTLIIIAVMKERIISFRINEAVMPDRDPP